MRSSGCGPHNVFTYTPYSIRSFVLARVSCWLETALSVREQELPQRRRQPVAGELLARRPRVLWHGVFPVPFAARRVSCAWDRRRWGSLPCNFNEAGEFVEEDVLRELEADHLQAQLAAAGAEDSHVD